VDDNCFTSGHMAKHKTLWAITISDTKVIQFIATILILSTTLTFGQGGQKNSIKENVKADFGLIDYKLSTDTLTLISTSDFLYYPFGVFNDVNALKKEYPKLFNYKNEFPYLSSGDSYVKFFFNDDKRRLETVYARIINPEIRLRNGIVTGMSKDEVLTKFFNSKPDNTDDLKVLKLESGLLGMWHYYTFDKNVLKSIYFDTDYQLDKN
jgi:hypothetical protein